MRKTYRFTVYRTVATEIDVDANDYDTALDKATEATRKLRNADFNEPRNNKDEIEYHSESDCAPAYECED